MNHDEMKKQTIAQLIETYNAQRVQNDDDVIVKWSKSKNALIDAIVEYVDAHNVDDEMTVAQLARELNVDPKRARAKLRRRGIFAQKNGAHRVFMRNDETYHEYVAIITNTRATSNDNA